MLKRTLNAVWYGAVFAVSMALTTAFALTITGRNSDNKNAIFQYGIPSISRENGITATPTPAIATAYQLTAGVSEVTTIATTGDAVKLPSTIYLTAPNSPAALNVIVINSNASNAVAVFPFAAGDTIVKSGAAGTPGASVSVPALTTLECFAFTDTKWYCQTG